MNSTDVTQPDQPEAQPRRINVPGFIGEEIGLGDAIKRVTGAMGITPCSGCKRRAEALNKRFTLSPSSDRKHK